MSLRLTRQVVLGVVLGCVVLRYGQLEAAEEPTRKNMVRPQAQAVVEPPPAEPAAVPPAPVASSPTASTPEKPTEGEVRAQLDGTRWTLELSPMAGSGAGKTHTDTISFTAKQITSTRLSEALYPASNYTLTIGDEGLVIWETMQTKEGTGVVFWRGELYGPTMRGVLSKHPIEGAAEDFSFAGQRSNGEPTGTAQEEQNASTRRMTTQAHVAPPSQPAGAEGTSPKKRRKGWFW